MSGADDWLADEPQRPRIGARGWLRVLRRGLPVALVLSGGLSLLLALRLIERPLHGQHRPWTPWITQGVCHATLWLMGISWRRHGRPMQGGGAIVSNHASWLDIFALNAADRIYFVAKAEVARWPVIGWLARATGTVFIRRRRQDARAQTELFISRLQAGHRLLFFPEGTSTDALRILPFKPTLFQAFFAEGLRENLRIQPATVIYHAPEGEDPRFYGWWGDMDFASHLLKILAAPRQGSVEVALHEPVRVCDFADRKSLAAACEKTVRESFDTCLPAPARRRLQAP